MTFCRECPFREPRLHNFLLVIPGNSSRGLSRLSCLSFTKTKIFRSCKHVIMKLYVVKDSRNFRCCQGRPEEWRGQFALGHKLKVGGGGK